MTLAARRFDPTYHRPLSEGGMHVSSETQAMKDSRAKYVGLGVALGAGIGTGLGVSTGYLAVWLPIGIAIGVAIGAGLSRKAAG
jgi:hypothetical protein